MREEEDLAEFDMLELASTATVYVYISLPLVNKGCKPCDIRQLLALALL